MDLLIDIGLQGVEHMTGHALRLKFRIKNTWCIITIT